MIFKPSSLPKLFFTYICPRFYGGAPATPSSTTSTQTINQSPWQNPVYQALMLGTADKPGPITSMLRSSAGQTAAWNDMLKGGYSPVPTQSQYSGYSAPIKAPTDFYTPTGTAASTYTLPAAIAPQPSQGDKANEIVAGSARGGLMSLKGYASGGDTTKDEGYKLTTATQSAKVQKAIDKALDKQKNNKKLSTKDVDLIRAYNTNQQMGGYGVITMVNGHPKLGPPAQGTMTDTDYGKLLTAFSGAGYTVDPKVADKFNIKSAADQTASDNLKNTIGTSITNVTADTEPVWKDGIVGGTIVGYKSTNEDFQKLQQAARDLKPPEQFKTATDMYGRSSAGLEAAAGYKPTDISANKADVANAAATSYNASNMNAPTDIAAQRGKVFGVDAASYQAQNMKAPTDIKALDYDAAQANAAQLDRSSVRDIAAQQAKVAKYKAEMMGAPSDISSQNYQAALADLNQMQGPKSWIDKGTSEAYMSPYMQNVVDIQKREANRDYAKQLQELNKQATAAGAYGGSRQAIERSEAARNQATRLGDIEAQGLEKAYQSGMGQFSAEQGLGLQAGQANLSAAQQTAQQNQAATNQQRSQYIQQALQAAQVNYGGQLTAAQQNQVAQNAAVQFNASAQNLANNNYSAQQLQAQQANQGVDFNVGQMNTTNQQQTNLANQTATNQQRALYVQQALQAAQVNYGGQLTAAQQNQVAQNASAQYNATNQQQANLSTQQAQNQAEQAYVQQALQAAQVNYGGQLTAAQQNQVAQNASAQYNATNAQNVNLENANAANTANNAYAQNQLAAGQANQQAGLTANQQGISALQGVGQNASGLTNTGTAANQVGLANLGAQGQVVQAQQALSQAGVNANQQTAQNALNFTNQTNAGVVAGVNAQPVGGGTQVNKDTSNPATWARGGLIKNGKVSKRGKK